MLSHGTFSDGAFAQGVSPELDSLRQVLRDHYRQDEEQVINELLALAASGPDVHEHACSRARKLVQSIRKAQIGKGGVDALLNEFALSTEEGIVLMCLAEALLRVPDKLTMDRLIRDKLRSGDWASHLGNSESLFVNASAWGLMLTGKVVSLDAEKLQAAQRDPRRQEPAHQQIRVLKKVVARLGEPVIRAAVRYALQVMGTQFVMGETIGSAITRARKQEARGYRYSYDMLGEGARTMADGNRYMQRYMHAIETIGQVANQRGPIASPGISVKLSAIHPRYEFAQRECVMTELLPRLKQLALAAKAYDIGFTVDAEEADRLDLSLDVIEALFTDPQLHGWEGFGLAVQAYQKRALPVIEWVRELAHRAGRKIKVRLVKGAYWDSEIKWSQIGGYSDYPVFTRKAATDVSYQACAKKLLAYRDVIYPQFATHNAYTVAAVLQLANADPVLRRQGFEFQRLHGMGEALYKQVLDNDKVPCRIYAPVGEHSDLLAYLVRRLLENGANSSFVNNVVDESVPVEALLQDPVATVRGWKVKRNRAIPLPRDLYKVGAAEVARSESGTRRNSAGADLTDINTLRDMQKRMRDWWSEQQAGILAAAGGRVAVSNPARRQELVGYLNYAEREMMLEKLAAAEAAFASWSVTPVVERAALLRKLADALEAKRDSLIVLCVKEAGKTIADGVSEVREAVDFCRYYADQAQRLMNSGTLTPRGVILCISPWNFPLAIFLGQVAAALATGNTVIAKPAEQTSLVAQKAMQLIEACGFPPGVVELVVAPGKPVGEQLVPDSRIQGVMFTGSTETGRWLARALADRPETDIPLIAETGGQNAMIVDSTALPEQVVDDVISSGFQSAGQRCSALRVLFLQEDVADTIITMITGAMRELRLGDPALLCTDVGPVIDTKARSSLEAHRTYLAGLGERARLLHRCELPEASESGIFFAPHLYEISDLSLLRREVFGPVVHVIRFKAYELDRVIDQINATGYGLTLGVHSRIQSVSARIAACARVGNVYINRNMIGAVVGVQPFGGRGLSGTGPKAGGPGYLTRLVKPALAAGEQSAPPTARLLQLGRDLPEATTLARAELGHLSWATVAGQEKVEVIRRFLFALESAPGAIDSASVDSLLDSGRKLCRLAEAYLLQPLVLPGPTGESNRLCLESRGVLCTLLEGNSSISEGMTQIIAALLAGNSVVALVDSAHSAWLEDCLQRLLEAGLPENVLLVLPLSVAAVVLSNPRVQGVLISAASTLAKPVQQLLAAREGALIPLLCETTPERLLQRMVVEKTITIDTTAAGGNTALLTMLDSGSTTLDSGQRSPPADG